MPNEISVYWFRRDLRLSDNEALSGALNSGLPVLPLFIFDTEIIDELPKDDPRLTFIYTELVKIHKQLSKYGGGVLIEKGNPIAVWQKLLALYKIKKVFVNRDYEPYSQKRDNIIISLLNSNGVAWFEKKDQVIFEKQDILKDNGEPYKVFTPYKNKWLKSLAKQAVDPVFSTSTMGYLQHEVAFPQLEQLGLKLSEIRVVPYDLSQVSNYGETRDFPSQNGTTQLGPHLRFGTIGIRELIKKMQPKSEIFINELIWREFFMQIIYHYPHVVNRNFNSKYDAVKWRNNTNEFEKWCAGKTGYPLVDAGMRQLNQTGFMHNRVRMVTASFLCKHLLIDWRWGEAYFAGKLLDYELSSNNGNWQWAAGTGCDAAPYFRVFNPTAQLDKFDENLQYVKQWVPEFGSNEYVTPIVEHSFARDRALKTYKQALERE